MITAQRQRGFTLMEMLVAVAVLAIALGAIIGNGSRFAGSAASLRDKSLALFVARNRMTEIELGKAWPALGKANEDVELGDVKWTWRSEVQATQDPSLRRVDIRVEKKGDKRATAYALLTGFISSVGREANP